MLFHYRTEEEIIDYNEITTTAAEIERPKRRRSRSRNKTRRNQTTSPPENADKVRFGDNRKEKSDDQATKTNVLRSGNKFQIISKPAAAVKPNQF